MLDGSKVVKICYDPELHREWKARLIVVAVMSCAIGLLLQWTLKILP